MLKSYGYMLLEPIKENLWFNLETGKWTKFDDIVACAEKGAYLKYDSYKMIHSLKAAKAHIKRHNEIPKGTQFRIIGRYVGMPDVIYTKR